MRLLFRQRFFSWFDCYDVCDEEGAVLYTVQGRLAWGHCLHILDASGCHIATVQERVLTLLPVFELYQGEEYVGAIRREFTFFRPRYDIDCNGWQVEGNFFEWDYAITDGGGRTVAVITKELLHLTDTYVIDVADRAGALGALMLVLAIDAEKCSRK